MPFESFKSQNAFNQLTLTTNIELDQNSFNTDISLI